MVQTSELHAPVMLQRCLDLLQPGFKTSNPIAIDCTLGLGGHTEALLAQNPTLTVIGIDRDPSAIALASERLGQFGERFIPVLAVSSTLLHFPPLCINLACFISRFGHLLLNEKTPRKRG